MKKRIIAFLKWCFWSDALLSILTVIGFVYLVSMFTSCGQPLIEKGTAHYTNNPKYPVMIISIDNDTILMDKEFKYFFWPSCEQVRGYIQCENFEAMRKKREINETVLGTVTTDSVIFNP